MRKELFSFDVAIKAKYVAKQARIDQQQPSGFLPRLHERRAECSQRLADVASSVHPQRESLSLGSILLAAVIAEDLTDVSLVQNNTSRVGAQ
jgi:hypothetical protein